jgi:hypothetical protein
MEQAIVATIDLGLVPEFGLDNGARGSGRFHRLSWSFWTRCDYDLTSLTVTIDFAKCINFDQRLRDILS